MTQARTLMMGVAVAALTFGFIGKEMKTPAAREEPMSESDIVIAADDTAPSGAEMTDDSAAGAQTEGNADESAKMGKEEGTHTGGGG